MTLETVWQIRRDELLSRYIATRPGQRPFAWRLVEAPEPRRCVSGDFVEAENDSWKSRWGIPLYAYRPDDQPMFKSQAAYLRRLILLTEIELDALDDAAKSLSQATDHPDAS